MKTKQIVGIVVTGVVIIAVGITGAFTNVLKNRMLEAQTSASRDIINRLWASQENIVENLPNENYIGILNIQGEISGSSASSWSSSSQYNHDLYMNYVDQMAADYNNKGILMYVNSPGGSVYQSDEMYLKLMEYKEKTGRPIWAYFADQACSGGYYIAMAADKIYANRNCWTGSIGVIVSLVNCKELYDKLGIKEIDITSGENKAMGSSALELTDEQQDILQSLVDEAYDQFVDIVCSGRGMDETTVRELADGRIYSAKQALSNGLIDEIGSLEEEKLDFSTTERLPENIRYFTPDNTIPGIMSTIFGMAESIIPKSDIDLAYDIIENKGNGVIKYYAK